MRVQRHTTGSVRYDKRRKTWNYLWYDGPTRRSKRIGTKQEFPTKAAAWREAHQLQIQTPKPQIGDTVRTVAEKYQKERMPTRQSTARTYRSFLNNHLLPKWGDTLIRDVQPRPVELWLHSLNLAPKSKTHLRSLMHSMCDFAMWSGMLEIGRNPVSLVRVQGASKRTRKPRSLTVEQFNALLTELHEPFATIALLCACLGLRISEALALKWSDMDWLGSRLSIRRGIVEQIVDDCKTEGSEKTFVLSPELLVRLRSCKLESKFGGPDDWIFASPVNHGRLPYSYTGTKQEMQRAAGAAGIGHIATHVFRHSFRTWLDTLKTPISVQQKLMRHSDIRMTMGVYGTVFDETVNDAGLRVAELVFKGSGAQTERESC